MCIFGISATNPSIRQKPGCGLKGLSHRRAGGERVQLVEHRTHPQGLADLLLYDALVDDGVLLLQDGALLAAWAFRGPDMASATHAEMAALSARLNNILRLGTGWMLQCDAIRSRAPEYPQQGAFPDIATRIIDDERRQQFTAEGMHFESEYFLCLGYLPPLES